MPSPSADNGPELDRGAVSPAPPTVIDVLTHRENEVVCFSASDSFKKLSDGDTGVPSDHQVLTTMRSLLGLSASMNVSNVMERLYYAEQKAYIVIRHQTLVYANITEKTFTARMDGLIDTVTSKVKMTLTQKPTLTQKTFWHAPISSRTNILCCATKGAPCGL